jgi:tRNA threonylcarbamoyladenosine biosynthesis protein TsaE
LILQIASPQQQEELGAALAQILPRGVVIYLQGELGTGKTTLTRGFMRGRGHHGAVKSPTYTLMEPYELESGRCFHLDLYRLGSARELEYLGIRDLLEGDATLLVEWPERGEGMLPEADIMVKIGYQDGGREVEISAASPDNAKLLKMLPDKLNNQE